MIVKLNFFVARYFCIVLLLGVLMRDTHAQFKIDLGEGRELQLSHSIQLWNVFTFQSAGRHDVSHRNDIFARRGRIGMEGRFREDMSFNVILAYDGIGKDPLTATAGSPNPEDNHDLFIWEASWMWSPSPYANVALGYFRPQAGKENITSEFFVLSFDKSLPDQQPRLHLVGRSTGREMGVNFGGLHLDSGWSVQYTVGIADPSHRSLVGNGTKWSPLLTGRVAFSLGDPEMPRYRLSYVQTYYGKRNGLTIGVNAAHQGETEIFESNALVGADALANCGPLDFNAEYDLLQRNSLLSSPATQSTTDRVFSCKVGYRIPINESQALVPTLAYTGERADDFGPAIHRNSLTGSSDQDLLDAGVNWLLNGDRLKLNLHYVWGKRYDRSPEPEFSYLGTGLQLLY